MKPKKDPKKDINNKSGLYFALGLVLVLALTFLALEWKSYPVKNIIDLSMNEVDTGLEEVTVKKFKVEEPPKPKIIPPKIKIEEDDAEIVETFVDAIEPNPDTEIPDLNDDDLDVKEVEEEVNVTWITIEEVPIFPGCETAKDKKACFSQMMQKHINKHFHYPEIAQELGIQGKVTTMFEIRSDGSIGKIQLRGPDKSLEEEAGRILSKLPKMTPGKQRGTPVKVSFAQPITFKLQ